MVPSSKSHTNLGNGIWYFHVRAKDNAGYWGAADHYRVQIFNPGWVSPTGYDDPKGEWNDEPYAYDENTNTKAYSNRYYIQQWTKFLVLTLPSPIRSNKIRFWAWYDADHCDQIDVDIYSNDAWVDVYQGSYAGYTWVEKTFSERSVTKARVAFHVIKGTWAYVVADLHEFDFYQSNHFLGLGEFMSPLDLLLKQANLL